MQIDYETLKALPKVDLHCHLDGSVRPDTIRDFLEGESREPPDDLDRRLRVPDDCNSLSEYLKSFELPVELLQSRSRLKRAARELAWDAADENIWYLEVRYAPYLHIKQDLTLKQVIQSVLEGLKEAEAERSIRTGVILTGIRQTDPSHTLRLAELGVEYKHQGVVGLDLAGAEKDNPPKEHLEAFYLARNHHLNVTIHAGEDFGPESIHQAIHYCGAHRIGHGVRLRENPELLEYIKDHRIPLEMCPTSNVQTGAVDSFGAHPLRSDLRQGLRVTLNTDNRTVSDTSLTGELHRSVQHFHLNLQDILQLITNGFKSAFLPHEERSSFIGKAREETKKTLFQRDLSVTEPE